MQFAGNAPADLGRIDIPDGEMLFAMYLPISVPGQESYKLPVNLQRFAELVTAAKWDDVERFKDCYVYLTAKTLWVEGSYIGNRPGWHCDGFGTGDVNYIWSDRAPTEFLIVQRGPLWDISEDCTLSMLQMAVIAENPCPYEARMIEFDDRHLLRLDETVIHRSPVDFEPGMRTFVKVSISEDRYDLKGNAVNPLLPETHWPLVDRKVTRNHPASA